MKILLLGATGRTGKQVLKSALDKGYEITCLVRKPEKVAKNSSVQIIKGNPINIFDLEKAIIDCNAIISVLNISRTSDFPWSKLRTPEKYLSEVMSTIISVATKNNIPRIIVCSAWGVSETKKEAPKWFNWFIDNSNIGVAYKDHERQEKLLEASNLQWTIVRPTGLINTNKEQKIKESFNNTPKPSLTISRKTVAKYMVDCLENNSLVGKKITISKG